jgi:FkbM family methyltransferase
MFPPPLKRAAHRTLGTQNYALATALFRLGRGYDKTYKGFLQLLPQGGRLLDIGANIGITTVFARRKRPDLKLIAFEPVPSNVAAAQRLFRIMRVNEVELHQVALGDSTGTVEMVMPKIAQMPASEQSHLVDDGYDYPSIADEGGERFTVPITMLDSLGLPCVDGIKLDVENFESQVLRGAKSLLKRDHPIIYCELWDTPNRQEVMTLLAGFGYSCQELDSKDNFLFS